MKEKDLKNSSLIWILSFFAQYIIEIFLDDHSDYFSFKSDYHTVLNISYIQLIVSVVVIIIPVCFDYLKARALNISVKEFYLETEEIGEIIRLFFILEFIACIFNILQGLCYLKIITRIESYNWFGIALIVLVFYLRYLTIKMKKERWESLSSDKKIIGWKSLIQDECFDRYKGEIILSGLLETLGLENVEIQVSVNNYFDYYEQFVEKLQSFSNKELIELRNFLKMQNRDNYSWSVQKAVSANLGKITISVIISVLSFTSIAQILSNLKKELILNGLISFLKYPVLFYVIGFLVFYVIKLVVYAFFIPYQRRVRNKNIESFLLSTIQSALDLRSNR